MAVDAKPVLTRSEETVMRLYTDGRTREEIAAAMVVSHHTVDAHLRNAKLKLCARNMAQAGARYVQVTMRHHRGHRDDAEPAEDGTGNDESA